MTAAWAWLKKYWEICAAGALLFLGVFVGWWFKKVPIIIDGEDPEKKAIDKQVAEETKQIQQEAAAQKEVLKEEHAEALEDIVAKQVEKAPELVKDPDATNDYLKSVGRSVRGDDDGVPR